MSDRFIRRIFNAEVMGLFLAFVAVQVLLYGISSSVRGTESGSLFWICLSAALIGLVGGRSRLNGIQAALWMGAIGIFIVWSLGARLAAPLADLVRGFLDVRPTVFPEIMFRFGVDGSRILSAWNTILTS